MDFDLNFASTSGNEKSDKNTIHDVVIIGSGPAGLSAALYTARAHLNPLILTGDQLGGQVSITSDVENYPGFPEAVGGPELVERMQKQAERFGAKVEFDIITEVDFSRRPFKLTGYDGTYYAKAVIVSTGATARKLQIPGETEYTGHGVSYCGTCDGFFFQDQEVVVIGGGDSALEEAIFLTKFATKVTVVHRRDEFRAGRTLQARIAKNKKISVIWDTVPLEVLGEDNRVTSIKLKNVKTGEEWAKPTDGVFIFIGHTPNSGIFKGQLDIDDHGYLVADKQMRTSVEGVWAAGEIADSVFRQVITSAGMGAAAGIAAERWLAEREEEDAALTISTDELEPVG